jgi:hypothetical protein
VKLSAVAAKVTPITSDVRSIPQSIRSVTGDFSTILTNLLHVLPDLRFAGAVFDILVELSTIAN